MNCLGRIALWAMSLACLLAVSESAEAQQKAAFQGQWLGHGCFGKNLPVVVSFSVQGETAIFHRMIDNEGVYTFEAPAPASWQMTGSVTHLLSTHREVKFDLHPSTDSPGRIEGTMGASSLWFSVMGLRAT